MAIRFGWPAWAGISRNDPPKSPWGNGGNGGSGDKGGGDGGSGGGDPRNPWSFPPSGKRSRPGTASSLDEFIRRARKGGGGFPGAGGSPALWLLIIGALLLVWLGLTSVHQIGRRERGVATFLGSYTGTLQPGIRFTLPWPLTSVRKIDVDNFREENFPNGSGENLMLTGDQNIVDLTYYIRWNIRSAPDYAFQIAQPEQTVRATAEAAMRAVVATASLNDTIGAGRARIEAQVQQLLQQILDEYRSGIQVQGVAIRNASAPQAVDEDFKQVSAAQQQAQANLNDARAYAQQVLAQAQGEAAEFDKIYEQYRLAPEVTRRRLYYETMEAVLARSDKTIVEAPGVTPYLPLPGLRRPTEPAAPETPARQQGANR